MDMVLQKWIYSAIDNDIVLQILIQYYRDIQTAIEMDKVQRWICIAKEMKYGAIEMDMALYRWIWCYRDGYGAIEMDMVLQRMIWRYSDGYSAIEIDIDVQRWIK